MDTILVVDDELIISQMIATVIEDAGYRALVAADGRAALELLEERGPPALIITDLMMPHLNGAALVRTLKSIPRFRHVPVVLMSAACHSHHLGAADHFLPKPFTLEAIEQFIEQYVHGIPRHSAPLVLPDMAPRRQIAYEQASSR